MRQNGLILRENFKQTETTLQTLTLLQKRTSFSTPLFVRASRLRCIRSSVIKAKGLELIVDTKPSLGTQGNQPDVQSNGAM